MRLIDADKLMENKFKNDISYNAFCNLVKRQPSIDAVPVIRCKDCKHHEDEENGMVYCKRVIGGWADEEWFCAGGERKES